MFKRTKPLSPLLSGLLSKIGLLRPQRPDVLQNNMFPGALEAHQKMTENKDNERVDVSFSSAAALQPRSDVDPQGLTDVEGVFHPYSPFNIDDQEPTVSLSNGFKITPHKENSGVVLSIEPPFSMDAMLRSKHSELSPELLALHSLDPFAFHGGTNTRTAMFQKQEPEQMSTVSPELLPLMSLKDFGDGRGVQVTILDKPDENEDRYAIAVKVLETPAINQFTNSIY